MKNFKFSTCIVGLFIAAACCGAYATDTSVNVTVNASGLPASISYVSAEKFDLTPGAQTYTNAIGYVDGIVIAAGDVTAMLASAAFIADYVNVSGNIWVNSARITRTYCLSGGRSVISWEPNLSETIYDTCATDAAVKAASK